MKTKSSKGFTLIELLVVIAIIGILAAIVLASLSTARSKANDAKVEGQLNEMRNAAEIYYATNNSYGGVVTASCTTGMFADSASGMQKLATSFPTGYSGVCNSSGTAWAASSALSTSGQYWCVDSTGTSKQATANLGSGATVCP